jgi:hypothetical protein
MAQWLLAREHRALTNGTLFTADTRVDDSHSATTAPTT